MPVFKSQFVLEISFVPLSHLRGLEKTGLHGGVAAPEPHDAEHMLPGKVTLPQLSALDGPCVPVCLTPSLLSAL